MSRIVALVFTIILLIGSMISPVLGMPSQKDDDESGITYCRDDDDDMNGQVSIDTSSDFCQKMLWVHYDDYTRSDEVRLYIYGKWSGTVSNSVTWSHRIKVNGEEATTFKTHLHFNNNAFIWSYFVIPKNVIISGACNWVYIGDKNTPTNAEDLDIGVDTSFSLPSTNPDSFQDVQRSWTDDEEQISGSFPWREFDGELMIYFEFVSIDEDQSFGHDSSCGWPVEIEEYKDWDGDSCGIQIDWTTKSQNDFDSIYKVRLYLYGHSSGSALMSANGIRISVNGNSIDINPNNHFPVFFSKWSGFEIYNMDDKLNWLTRGGNEIKIYATDFDNQKNNLVLLTQNTDSDDTWYHFWDEDLGDDGEWVGAYNDPDDPANSKDILFRIEVYESRSTNDIGGTGLTEYGIIDMHSYYWYDDELDTTGITGIKTDLDNIGYSKTFDVSGPFATQWLVFGEKRSKYDVGGDLVDLLIFYGLGDQESIRLYYNDIDSALDDPVYDKRREYDREHTNDDQLDFSSSHLDSCTEAEGNEAEPWGPYQGKDVGSDGFDYDCEWVFFFSDNTLKGHDTDKTGDNDFQTLLYHGLHAVYGFTGDFDEWEWDALQTVMCTVIDLCWGTEDYPMTIMDAFRTACEDVDIYEWACYYHSENDDDYLWGVSGSERIVTQDEIGRDDIMFISGGEP